jgi:hypothetical protein
MTRRLRETRERLNASLDELSHIRPAALLREEVLGRALCFRTGLEYFERTLELFHRLSRCDLDHVPLVVLESIADDAASTVDQFRAILSFTTKNLENPREARDFLIYDVRNSYERISTNVEIVVSQRARWQQGIARSKRPALTVALCTLLFVLAVIVYYSIYDKPITDKILNAVRRVRMS